MAVSRDTDALIVGAGPAGLAAAIALRAKGLRALVADCAGPEIDKACGEGLMPDAVAALRALGVTPAAGHSFPFAGIRFIGEGGRVEAGFPGGSGLGVRRTYLHGALAARAREVGVEFCWGEPFRALSVEGATIGERAVRCRWVIGADGQNSRVRRAADLDACRSFGRRFGSRRHYRIAPWTNCTEVYWRPRCQIYITPVGREEVCVALLARDGRERIETGLAALPEVAARLRGAIPSSAGRGAVTASRVLRRVAAGRTALVGDASGSVDAITGEGLSLAFRQALALADALASDDLASYERAHRRIMRRPRFMAGLLLALDRSPWLRGRAIGALAARPAIFARLVALHVGELTPAGFALDGLLPPGRRIWEKGLTPPR